MAETPNVLHVNVRDEEPVKRAFDGMLDQLSRAKEQVDGLRNVCAYAAAALGELEFREDEAEDQALTQRLIDSLTGAAGRERVEAVLVAHQTPDSTS